MPRQSLYLVSWALLCFTGPTLAAPEDTFVKELSPGVYFRKAQTAPKFTGCNQGFVVFKDHVLVIDANFPGQAKEVIEIIKKHTEKPIKCVFDTHHHGDHADGNQQYAKIGAVAIAAERSRPLFDTKGEQGFLSAQKTDPQYKDLPYHKPTMYFEHKLVLDDGEQRVEFLWMGHGHTAGDAVAWLPKQGILFTGDACINGAFNYMGDANTASWITLLNQFEELPIKLLCPGHGEMGGKEIIAAQRRYFVDLRAAVKQGLDASQPLETIQKEISIPWYKEWAGVEANTRTENVAHVYGELTGKPVDAPK